MQSSPGIFIDNQPRTGGGEIVPLINPATEETFASIQSASADDLERAVTGAHRAFKQDWRDIAPGRRAEILFNIARLIREHREELAQLDMLSVGKPISDARDEVMLGARIFEYYA